ncbi:MAG TPA: 3'(2'),5'-bisphosphate nucleotidase CysQ [Rubrivivax sp.]|nr:3'(2'),5'-bisphosphate nucleotidase CysQ [Rubrivivax sp.]
MLPAVERIARQAGDVILDIYGSDFTVREKADASPVTQADERAEALIVPALRSLSPSFPVVAEEAASRGENPGVDHSCWLVDPLDGTREFVARSGEFTVNIGLVVQGVPLLGVVFAPVHDTLYAGIAGLGAWVDRGGHRLAIRCRRVPLEGATLATSRWHGSDAALHDWLQGKLVAGRITAGSSLKFGLLAEGRADLYPRFGRTMEWDTAAGDAVLTAAGGKVVDLQGRALRYGKPGFENPDFVAYGGG